MTDLGLRRGLLRERLARVLSSRTSIRTCRSLARLLTDPLRKASLVMVSGALALWASWNGRTLAGAVVAAPGLAIVWASLGSRWSRRNRVRRAGARIRSTRDVPPASATLAEMGLDPETIERLLEGSEKGDEPVVAELDQNNRVLSHVGPIPLYDEILIDVSEFRKRSRNRLEIVVTRGVVAVKKSFSLLDRFRNEVIALDALASVDGVPRLLAVDLRSRVIHQSLIPGRNLGSLMTAHGATVSMQYRLSKAYPGPGRWRRAGTGPQARDQIIRALHESVDGEFLTALARLVTQVHEAGVTLRDIKHGNVLVCQGRPYLCDFDLARCHRRRGPVFVTARERERDRFEYLFGVPLGAGSAVSPGASDRGQLGGARAAPDFARSPRPKSPTRTR